MPRCLSPNDTDRYVLQSDRQLPLAEQPYFLFRTLNGVQYRDVTRLMAQTRDLGESNPAEAIDGLFAALDVGLAGWGNMVDRTQTPHSKIPFGSTAPNQILDPSEAGELVQAMLRGAELSADDKKKSD
jgi:hypothetical protein